MYQVVSSDLKAELAKMTDDDKSKYIFLSRREGLEPIWEINFLVKRDRCEGTVHACDFKMYLDEEQRNGYNVVFLSDPAEDMKIAALVGHKFCWPRTFKGLELLQAGKLELETKDGVRYNYDVGHWWKEDLKQKVPSAIIVC